MFYQKLIQMNYKGSFCFQLFVPEKVLIPERYNPESDDDDVTEEKQQRRQAKAEKIQRLLTQQRYVLSIIRF